MISLSPLLKNGSLFSFLTVHTTEINTITLKLLKITHTDS